MSLTLPPFITNCFQKQLAHLSLRDLQFLSREITHAYQGDAVLKKKAISSLEQAWVYAAVRLPATYAVIQTVFSELPEELIIHSILDMGTGPGTLLWGACTYFQELKSITGIEINPYMLVLAQKLAVNFQISCELIQKNLLDLKECLPHDLVTLSYVLSELPSQGLIPVLEAAWNTASQGLILIDTGTPKGFEVIKKARTYFIEKGGYCYAPCGHEAACPMTSPDWCHFSVRLNREPLHQRIKQGTMGWEDEKYSYLILLKNSFPPKGQRILKKPLKNKRHLILEVCQETGVMLKPFSKRDAAYKDVRKLQWGGLLPF